MRETPCNRRGDPPEVKGECRPDTPSQSCLDPARAQYCPSVCASPSSDGWHPARTAPPVLPTVSFSDPRGPALAAGSTPATAPARSEAGTTPRSPWGTLRLGGSLYPASPDACGGQVAGRKGRERLTWGGAAGPRASPLPERPLAPPRRRPGPVSQRAPRRWTRPPAAARGPAPSGPAGRWAFAAGGARGGAGGPAAGRARRRHAGAVSAAPRGLGSPPRRGAPRTKARTGRGRSAGTPVAFARPARGRPRFKEWPHV